MTVVLVGLLAIVGILFVLMSRVDRIASTATGQNKELDMALDSVLSRLSDTLVADVPGVANQEYYDSWGVDKWLSSQEPNDQGGQFVWQQITELDVNQPDETLYRNIAAVVVKDTTPIDVTPDGEVKGLQIADADGEGIGDSKWIRLPRVKANQNRPMYAAVRMIGHNAMLNLNTGYEFYSPNSDQTIVDANRPYTRSFRDFDGSHQMQIDLVSLVDPNLALAFLEYHAEAEKLHRARCGDPDLDAYLKKVVWSFDVPDQDYSPFDISDELELRNRFILNHQAIETRLEGVWTQFGDGLRVPQDSLQNWGDYMIKAFGGVDPKYDIRHITTCYSIDRAIDPEGQPMANINTATVADLYQAFYRGLRVPDEGQRQRVAAQLAVNLVDFRDSDLVPTQYTQSGMADPVYGIELHPYISEIAYRIDINTPTENIFAVELMNPSDTDLVLGNLSLELRDATDNSFYRDIPLDSFTMSDDQARFVVANKAMGEEDHVSTDLICASYRFVEDHFEFDKHYDIYLIAEVNGDSVYLDVFESEAAWFAVDANNPAPVAVWNSHARDDEAWNVVYQVDYEQAGGHTLNQKNRIDPNTVNTGRDSFTFLDPVYYPKSRQGGRQYVTVGEISRLLAVGPGTDPNDPNATVGARLTDSRSGLDDIFFDINRYEYRGIFQYLTVLPQSTDPNETRIKGRININTAPWYVLDRLPWMSHLSSQEKTSIAQAIVARRDSADVKGFRSIGDLMMVPEMKILQDNEMSDRWDEANNRGPDFSPDTSLDDLEERDLLFHRISNLVTVRSDVFSAYILVRMGANGPQRRMLAILDRSQVDSPDDRVKIVALHRVPDPR